MKLLSILRNRRMNPETMGPIKVQLNEAKQTLKTLPHINKWMDLGYRSAAVAASLLREGKIIAIPTDTIYGLAGLAQNNEAIARLYEIKKRDQSKPLAICLWNTDDIEKWAHVDHLPPGLIEVLLPGPRTLILKRKNSLNPLLNPGERNVGIRVPKYDFVRSVVKMANEPIALTSANISQQRSTLHPNEFTELWPSLDGIFFEKAKQVEVPNSWRKGSTIVDLTVKGEFHIVRKGISYLKTIQLLRTYKLKKRKIDNSSEGSTTASDSEKQDTEIVLEEKACTSG